MGVSVKVDLGGVTRKLSQANLNRGQYAMANQMLADMNQFVPKKESSLRTTGHVSADGKQVVWDTPYAKAQFYGTNGRATFRKYSTPGTGPRWDLKAKPIFMNDWTKAFKGGAGL